MKKVLLLSLGLLVGMAGFAQVSLAFLGNVIGIVVHIDGLRIGFDMPAAGRAYAAPGHDLHRGGSGEALFF